MKLYQRILAITIISLASILGFRGTQAQTNDRRYFHATGHWVEGEFLRKYEETDEAELVFGDPITDRFKDHISAVEVQYFERARFELHPDEFPPVRLTPLGELTYEPGIPFPIPATTQACKRFKPSGPRVCLNFLHFFESHGGVAQFGYPVSELEIKDGYLVQYFQRARFEWHPERNPGDQVVLSNLGLKYFQIRGETLERLEPTDFIPYSTPQSLKINVFPENPLMSYSGYQTISVIVRDQYSQPVEGAKIAGFILLPDGQEITLPLQTTNEKGIVTTSTILINSKQIGIAEVTILVEHGNIQKEAGASFQIW